MFQDVTAAVIELVLQDIPFITVRLISILGMFCYYNRLPSENEKNLQCFQYKAVIINSLVVEQRCVVYKISIPKCFYFVTFFNRRLGT